MCNAWNEIQDVLEKSERRRPRNTQGINRKIILILMIIVSWLEGNEFIRTEYGQLAVTCEENNKLRSVYVAGHFLT